MLVFKSSNLQMGVYEQLVVNSSIKIIICIHLYFMI